MSDFLHPWISSPGPRLSPAQERGVTEGLPVASPSAGAEASDLAVARLAAIVDASADAIISTDLDRIVTSWNPAAERIFGYPAREMVGHLCVRLVPPDLDGEELGFFTRIRAGERVEAFDTVRITRDGRRIDVSISVAPIKDAAGNVVGAAKVIRDITERQQTEALRHAKAEAERANLAKSEFLSRMSHELRTPMNAILGFGQLLELDALGPKQEESVNHILRAGRHLLSLVDEVLDLAHVESGRLEVSLETVHLGDVVLETLALMNPLAAKRDVTLKVNASPGQPLPAGDVGAWPRIIADRRRLQQVLFNLLGNAIKYNSVGGQVTVDHVPTVGTDQLRLRVADTGPGITREQRERLFTPFERLGAERGEVAGNGLGLSVAKALMEAMGGELGLEDKPAHALPGAPGPGAVFWIALPLAEPPWSGATG